MIECYELSFFLFDRLDDIDGLGLHFVVGKPLCVCLVVGAIQVSGVF